MAFATSIALEVYCETNGGPTEAARFRDLQKAGVQHLELAGPKGTTPSLGSFIAARRALPDAEINVRIAPPLPADRQPFEYVPREIETMKNSITEFSLAGADGFSVATNSYLTSLTAYENTVPVPNTGALKQLVTAAGDKPVSFASKAFDVFLNHRNGGAIDNAMLIHECGVKSIGNTPLAPPEGYDQSVEAKYDVMNIIRLSLNQPEKQVALRYSLDYSPDALPVVQASFKTAESPVLPDPVAFIATTRKLEQHGIGILRAQRAPAPADNAAHTRPKGFILQ